MSKTLILKLGFLFNLKFIYCFFPQGDSGGPIVYARYEEENLYGWRRAGDINEDNSQVGDSDIGKGQDRGVKTDNSRDGTTNPKTHQAGNLNAGNSEARVNNIVDMGRSNSINTGHSRAGEVRVGENEAQVENAMNFNAGVSQVELQNSREGEMKTGVSQIGNGNFGDSQEGYQETFEEHRSDLLTFLTGQQLGSPSGKLMSMMDLYK